jgi:hypothetical protein
MLSLGVKYIYYLSKNHPTLQLGVDGRILAKILAHNSKNTLRLA